MRIEREIHKVQKDFFGYKMMTRVRYMDESILNKEMDIDRNMYRLPKNLKVVIDVGAHIGGTSILAASMGATVYAFEPEDYNYELLCQNIDLNIVGGVVHPIKLGVGEPGKHTLFIHPRNSGAATTIKYPRMQYQDEHKQTIEIISIHDVFEKYNIEHCDVLKMDCEGGEAAIIKDLDEDLINKIDRISLEYHNKPIWKNEIYPKLIKYYEPEEVTRHEWTFKRK